MKLNYKQGLDIAIWLTTMAMAMATSISHIDLSTPQGRGAAVVPLFAVLLAALKSPPDLAKDATPHA